MYFIILLPLMETLVFNVIALNYCFERKYSSLKTVIAFCACAIIFFLPWSTFRNDIASGDGRFAFIGLLYILLLKFLYKEKLTRLILGMCMTWVFTQGIISLCTQVVGLFVPEDQNLPLIVFESVALLLFMIPFRRYIIPKYRYIFQYMVDLRKPEFRHLTMVVYFNLVILFIFHAIFLDSPASISKVLVLAFFLTANYLFYTIIYEVIISNVKISELEISNLQDSLTGLGNRKKLMRRMDSLLEGGDEFSVMFLDLDKFKQVNDTYGYAVGDKYLVHFSKLCSKDLGEKGELFRYGGDEFVAIYNGVLTEEKANFIIGCKTWDHGAPCKFNKASMGYVVCRPPFDNVFAIDILRQADSIMYESKIKNRGKKDVGIKTKGADERGNKDGVPIDPVKKENGVAPGK